MVYKERISALDFRSKFGFRSREDGRERFQRESFEVKEGNHGAEKISHVKFAGSYGGKREKAGAIRENRSPPMHAEKITLPVKPVRSTSLINALVNEKLARMEGKISANQKSSWS
jgi:hypothetical protein